VQIQIVFLQLIDQIFELNLVGNGPPGFSHSWQVFGSSSQLLHFALESLHYSTRILQTAISKTFYSGNKA